MKIYKAMIGLIIFLLFLSSFVIVIPVEKCTTGGNNIYVKGNYPYSNGDGSADHPYRSIQHAIDVADEGDTIYVFEGTYNESLQIDKQISLIGLDRDNTTINKIGKRPRYLIEVTASHVVIEDLTISDIYHVTRVALIYSTADYLTLEGVNITDSDTWGIYLDSSQGNTIGNSIMNVTKGIYSYYSDNNVFSNNDLCNSSEAAIQLYKSDNNIIFSNRFFNNKYGVYSQNSNNNNISGNTINNSALDGIKLYSGSNNVVRNNSVTYNNGNGVYISSSDSKIMASTLTNNQIGINLVGSDCDISSNVIKDSTLWGVYADSSSKNNIIYLNQFATNNKNARDDGNNQWYYDNQGNYWDDYNEVDRNLDGIGDAPYITDGGGRDLFPLGYFLKPPNKPENVNPTDGEDEVGLSVTLSVTVSDPDSNYLDVYFYCATDDKFYGATYGVKSGEKANFSFTLPFETTFAWYAIVNDSKLENKSDIWIFTTRQIPPLNKKPVADPGGPYVADIGEEVEFDASDSYDPDGVIDFYRWNFGDGSSEILDPSPKHVYDDTGTYVVTLTIVDNDGRSDTSQTAVTVGAFAPNLKPIASSSSPYSGTAGKSITFNGSGSYDLDGTIESYTWDFGDGNFGHGNVTSHTFENEGTYEVTLYVVDDDGDTNSTSVTVTIEPASSGLLPGIPGFELVLVIAAIVSISLWKKYRK